MDGAVLALFLVKAEASAQVFHGSRGRFAALCAGNGGQEAFGVSGRPEKVSGFQQAGQLVRGDQRHVFGIAPPDNHGLTGGCHFGTE